MKRVQLIAIVALAVTLKLVIGGCSNDNTNPGGGDGGGSTDLAGGSTDLAGSSTDMAMQQQATCASLAAATCNQLSTCAPNIFKFSYENSTICNAVLTKSCMDNQT